mgnify:CR=1 FL=1
MSRYQLILVKSGTSLTLDAKDVLLLETVETESPLSPGCLLQVEIQNSNGTITQIVTTAMELLHGTKHG